MENMQQNSHNPADNRFIWGYYLIILLPILFLIYHAISIEVVATAEFPTDVPPYVCPIVSLH